MQISPTFRLRRLAALALLALVGSPSSPAGEFSSPTADTISRSGRWTGANATLDFGPAWRSTEIAGRGNIPHTIGGSVGLTLRTAIFSSLFIASSTQYAVTAQMAGRTNGTVGDWSGSELFPFIPTIGIRLGSVQLSAGYPMFGSLTLLSKASNGEQVKYTQGRFWQGTLAFETETGLFGAQYRTGTFQVESVGAAANTLDPKMKCGNFTLLFSLPFAN